MSHRPSSPHATIPAGLDVDGTLSDGVRVAALPDPHDATREALDHVAALAAHALVGDESYVILLGADAQRIVGRTRDLADPGREDGLCPFTLALGEPLLLGDVLEDPLAAATPGLDRVRAYAGTSIRVTGERVGTLCVACERPRAWTIDDANRLVKLAEIAGDLLDR